MPKPPKSVGLLQMSQPTRWAALVDSDWVMGHPDSLVSSDSSWKLINMPNHFLQQITTPVVMFNHNVYENMQVF